jgi:signal transduction histidine kinase
MARLALVSLSRPVERPASAQVAHDIRNILTTIGLHLETLERLAGAPGAKPISAAQALAAKAADLCNAVIEGPGLGTTGTRGCVDLMSTVGQIAELLSPVAPDEFSVEIEPNNPVNVLADPAEVFRMLFNILSNAAAVARQTGRLKRVTASVMRGETMISLRLSDDGPGLPPHVRARLFQPPEPGRPSGHGLAIARALAERNGGTLSLAASRFGAAFVLTLPAFQLASAEESLVSRSLRIRAAR